MSFEDAIAQQPQWVQLWLNVLVFGAFILPAALLIWRQTRLTAIVTVIVSVTAGVAVMWLYDRMGYVRLLGLPHVLLWTPLVLYLIGQVRRGDVPQIARYVLGGIIGTLLISLAFDYADLIRYILGERTPTIPPPA